MIWIIHLFLVTSNCRMILHGGRGGMAHPCPVNMLNRMVSFFDIACIVATIYYRPDYT